MRIARPDCLMIAFPWALQARHKSLADRFRHLEEHQKHGKTKSEGWIPDQFQSLSNVEHANREL